MLDDIDRRLIRLAQGGDIHARNDLVQRHLRFIYSVIRRVIPIDQEPEEWIGLGVQAFIDTIRLFDDTRSGSLTTYGFRAIAHRLYNALRQDSCIQIPSNKVPVRISEYAKRAKRTRSLSDMLPDGRPRYQPAAIATAQDSFETSERLTLAFEALPDRHREVLAGRSKGRTFREIGKEISVSRERVRQIEEEAMEQLRGMMER